MLTKNAASRSVDANVVWLLIRDYIRRTVSNPPVFVFVFASAWINIAGSRSDKIAFAFGGSLSLAFAVGPLSVMNFERREIRLLPVSRRQLWLAKWTIGTIGATLVTTLTKVFATVLAIIVSRTPLLTWPSILLSSMYDFLYTGATFGLGLALPILATPKLVTALPKIVRSAAGSMLIIALVGGLFWGLIFRASLPTTWPQLSIKAIVVLAAGLVLTVIGYLHSPKIKARARPSKLWIGRKAASSRTSREAFSDRFTGVARLIWREWRITAILVAWAAASTLTYALIFDRHESLAMFANRSLLLPFSDVSLSFSSDESQPMFWIFAAIVIVVRGGYRPMIRHFRTLPLSTAELSALFISNPAIAWINVWTALLLVQLIGVGRLPTSLRLDLLLSLIGLSALLNAVSLTWRKRSWIQSIVFLATLTGGAALGFTIADLPPATARIAMTAAGALALGTAASLNSWTLRRSNVVYAVDESGSRSRPS